MDQWLYSISDHCFDDPTNYRQNCYSLIVDGIVFASDVKRCTLSYYTMDRRGWQYGSKRLGMVYWTHNVGANQIEFATRSRWTSKNDIFFKISVFSIFFLFLMKFYQKNSHMRRIWIDFLILFERIFNNNKIFFREIGNILQSRVNMWNFQFSAIFLQNPLFLPQ